MGAWKEKKRERERERKRARTRTSAEEEEQPGLTPEGPPPRTSRVWRSAFGGPRLALCQRRNLRLGIGRSREAGRRPEANTP